MSGQVRSEFLKVRTTRTGAILLLAAASLTLLGGVAQGLSASLHDLAGEETQRKMFSSAGSSVVLFATFVGLLVVTNEFRYGTIHPTFLSEPRRRVVLTAKLLSAATIGALFGLVGVGLSFAGGLAVLGARNVTMVVSDTHVVALVLGPVAAGAVGAMLGVAVGAIIRNQIGAVTAVVAYALIVDAVMFAAMPSVGRFLPGKASDALAGLPTKHLLSPSAGAATYVAWMLALVVLGAIRTERSDV